jgi:hypothetical protein
MLGAMGFMETCALIALAVGFFGGTAFVVFLRWLRGSDTQKRKQNEKRKPERKRK